MAKDYKSSKEIFEDAIDKIQDGLNDLEGLHGIDLEHLKNQLVHVLGELNLVPKDDSYWSDFD